MTPLYQARANYLRAETIHEREQARGKSDGSVRQTRRMALAVASLQRAYRRWQDECRKLPGGAK